MPEWRDLSFIDREGWEALCKSRTARDIRQKNAIYYTTQLRLTEKYGIAPYMKCVHKHLAPREKFANGYARVCEDCKGKASTPLQDFKREEALFKREKELSRTTLWRATDGPLSYWVRHEIEWAV